MNILERFELFHTQLKNSKFEIYVDYKATNYILNNSIEGQTILKRVAGTEDTELSVYEFLQHECRSLCCFNDMLAFGNCNKKSLDTFVGSEEITEAYFDVELISELRVLNIVSSFLYNIQELFDDGTYEDIRLAYTCYMCEREVEFITNYNYSKLNRSKGAFAGLKKNLTGVIGIPQHYTSNLNDGNLITGLPLQNFYNENSKLDCFMRLPNSIPFHTNSAENDVCAVYHIGQLLDKLNLQDNKEANGFMQNNPIMCIRLLYYILNKELHNRLVTVFVIDNKIQPSFTLTVEDTTELKEMMAEYNCSIARIDFLDFVYHAYSFGYMPLSEFKKAVEVLI